MNLTPITPKRVVITGIGVITPIGNNLQTFWDSLENGKGGIDHITRMDITDYPSKIGAEVKDFNSDDYFDRKEARHLDPFCKFGLAAGVQAIENSSINFDDCDRDRVGVIIGSGIGGMYIYEEQVHIIRDKGPKRINPFFIPMMIADIIAGHISIRYSLRGPNYATTSACATSGHAIGLAAKTIRWGEADVMITGGAEAPITPIGLGGFCALRALSTRNDDPEHACRPFDKERDGFIIGEGGCVMVLESAEHAIARNAHIYGEISGVGFTGDAHHITAPPDDGNGAARAMKTAIQDAGLKLEDVEYINAHGTSTPLNDKSESFAIKSLFGEHAQNLIVSSTKSMHGHLLGAAGAVELAATTLGIERGVIPPTINYEIPDPECDLNYAPNQAIRKTFNIALSNTFGFGGHNASILIRRWQA